MSKTKPNAVMPRPLFVYGTLRDPDILAAILGRTLHPAHVQAVTAPGYAAVHYPGRVYPALVAHPAGAAPGLLLSGLEALDLALLDAFEGDEYERRAVTVMSAAGAVPADAYLPTIDIDPDGPVWTLEAWAQAHKPNVLGGETSTAQALRRRLSARIPV